MNIILFFSLMFVAVFFSLLIVTKLVNVCIDKTKSYNLTLECSVASISWAGVFTYLLLIK